jgi:hypothetical protein
VKVIAPDFFSNLNEEPLMAIICAWTTGVLCIKNGIYHDDALENEQAEEEDFFS